MLFRVLMSLSFMGALSFLMITENPDIKQGRDALAAAMSSFRHAEMQSAEDTRSSLRKLQARNSYAASPCIMASQCSGGDKGIEALGNMLADQGDRMDAMYSVPQSQIKPLFIQVDPPK
jgi:hypothetical protein